MKFYFVIDINGQLRDHVNLTKWKVSKKSLFPILKERTRGGKTVFGCWFVRIYLWCFNIEAFYVKVINQITNSINSVLPAFSSE